MTKTPAPKRAEPAAESCSLCKRPIPDVAVRYVMDEHSVCCESCRETLRRKKHA